MPDMRIGARNSARLRSLTATAAAQALAGACTPPPDWYRPDVATTWQWQLQPDADGRINIGYDVDVYDLDLFDTPDDVLAALRADGRRVIAYFSAGSYEGFRSDSDLFADDVLGDPLDGFADERWLDIRSQGVRQIMLARLDLAAERGFDGVEPDNVDGYANETGFPLTAEDQLDFNRFLAAAAHERGLAVGLKNDLDQVAELVDDFDFAVNEQCHEFDECDRLTPFVEADKPVFNAEYEEEFVSDDEARAGLCEASRRRSLQTLVLPLALDDSFRLDCR
jgi:hypothetical protein